MDLLNGHTILPTIRSNPNRDEVGSFAMVRLNEIAPSIYLHQFSYRQEPHHDAVGLLQASRSSTSRTVPVSILALYMVAVRGAENGCSAALAKSCMSAVHRTVILRVPAWRPGVTIFSRSLDSVAGQSAFLVTCPCYRRIWGRRLNGFIQSRTNRIVMARRWRECIVEIRNR